jgi:hypothetical protein
MVFNWLGSAFVQLGFPNLTSSFSHLRHIVMSKVIPSLLLVATFGVPAPLLAGGLTGDAMLGGALGGALGAGIGSELGGRDGAILGGALGGAAGTAITTRRHRRPEVIYVDRYGPPRGYYSHPGRHRGHYKHKYRRYYYDYD